MSFRMDQIGLPSPDQVFVVDAQATKAYAEATNDLNPRYLRGELAPPLFAVVPSWEPLQDCIRRVAAPDILLRVVHGKQDMQFCRPIVPGDVLVSRGVPVGVHIRGSGTILVIRLETWDQSAELVNEQVVTAFFRGVTAEESAGDAPLEDASVDSTRRADPAATVMLPVDADQSLRYAEASGDRLPIHTDPAVAHSVGLPGVILHGLCSMAFAGRALVDTLASGDPGKLRRLAVRFSSPAFPGQPLRCTIWGTGKPDAYAFEMANADSKVVLRNGRAELA
jgi:acyl dehydratase